jgi:peptidoglycan/LPS O-acetylase OafA/YrhL
MDEKPAAETIGQAFDRVGGRSTGFDYLRLGLACAVLFWHSFRVTDVSIGYDGWWGPLVRLILPMFFALSGFLVAGSLLRVSNIHQFLVLRVLRIMPALWVVVGVSVLVIGPLFTTLPLGDYLVHPQTRDYVWNIVARTRYLLPGVFDSNPVDVVNASLWTIKYELDAYILIVLLFLVGAIRRPRLLLPLVLVGQFLAPAIDMFSATPVREVGPVSGYTLIVSFTFGTVLFVARDLVPLRRSWGILSGVLALALLSTHVSGYFAGPAAAYFTVWLGLMNPRRTLAVDKADISYGVYLWAYPVQQMVVALLPDARVWWANAAISLVITAGIAALSWRYVEKPALDGRKRALAWSDRVMARLTGRAAA